MNGISATITGTRFVEAIPRFCTQVLSGYALLVEKIKTAAYPYLTASSGMYYTASGSFEARSVIKAKKQEEDPLAPSKSYSVSHGLLVTGAGLCGIAEGLNSFGVIRYGEWTNRICFAGSIFFLYANLIALEEGVRIYEEIKKQEAEGNHVDNFKKNSVTWGIVSSLGYVIATAAVFLSAPASLAFVFGVVGSFSGALKVLSDFLAKGEASLEQLTSGKKV